MRKFENKFMPESPWLALCTSEYVSPEYPIMLADFRDTYALYHPKLDSFIGLNKYGDLLSGKADLILKNGIWYLEADENKIARYQSMSPSDCILKEIK
jgi:hypothetical protein